MTAIAPGWTVTDMAAIVYLASPEADFAAGTVLDLNGGSYLRK
ncbi:MULTISPECIES: hypothetical protein [Kribbella]|nr:MULTISPECIES: hypothetical protein [Kribbella]